MFDYHLHSRVSFDTETRAQDIIRAAESSGLREICFTDHYDYNSYPEREHNLFTIEDYKGEYEGITSPSITVKHGVEFGMTEWNTLELSALLKAYPFDFVIGSVHFVDGYDPYHSKYWENKTLDEAFSSYLEQVLACVKVHKDFDVLGHINYVCKSVHNPSHKPLKYKDYADISDEIMKTLVLNGKGMEINTSGIERVGDFLPSYDFLKRFRELGGEIVTVGSDAHDVSRVGEHTNAALEILKDIFGYVCTFDGRKPKFIKL